MTLLRPSGTLVGLGWIGLAIPDVRAGIRVPAADDGLRTGGFLRVQVSGGSPDRDVPLRTTVVAFECWVAPPLDGTVVNAWFRAEHLAERVIAATYDPTLMGRQIDLSGTGTYAAAYVRTATALAEPRRVDNDPSNWARFDVDVALAWTAAS
jgi:hypothetical protein